MLHRVAYGGNERFEKHPSLRRFATRTFRIEGEQAAQKNPSFQCEPPDSVNRGVPLLQPFIANEKAMR